MKMNWGTGITIGMITFMAFIITLSTKMINTKVDLVAKDYYEQGIGFQQHINNVAAASSLNQPVQVDINNEEEALNISFPSEFENNQIEGTILLFCPADVDKDISIPIKVDTLLRQNISLKKMNSGIWRVKLQWKVKGTSYYSEHEIEV